MPVIDADGCPIHVEIEGPERAPVLMLSNSLGTNLHMWDGQVADFLQRFRLVRYDRRGHGSPVVRRGPIQWRVSAATRSRCSTASDSKV
jgi:3-oxoadipate enol-lactonase